jgi:Periplasmic protein involved in polysaccharide export
MERLDNRRPLSVGDTVSYQIVEEREAPVNLEVASSGEIEVPLVGRVPAAGRTPKAVAYAIKAELEKELYKKATVIVALQSETTRPEGTFYVTGQVQSQGPQEIPRGEEITVAQAILRAGGFADFADKRRVTVVRRNPDGSIVRTVVDVKDVLEKGHLDKDIVLQPGDYVFVRERMFNF